MREQFERTALVLGQDAMDRLCRSSVLVFGIGGVGGHVVEALARSGVGAIALVDNDSVDITNLNRQIMALHSTVGQPKVDVARQRVLDINPDCKVTTYRMFYLPETADQIDLKGYDYVVDCIDTVTAKLDLIERCKALGVPVISSMGTGNKVDPTKLKVADISKTSVCPLARVMRTELRKRGINHLKCVFSTELPAQQKGEVPNQRAGRHSPGSTAFVPSVAGLVLASEVIRDLSGFGGSDVQV